MEIWEVRRDNAVVAWGPIESMPSPKERKVFRADGYKIYVAGKLYKD